MSVLDKLKKNTTIKESEVLTHSKFFNQKDFIQTTVPALNVALSGKLDGGLSSGLTVFHAHLNISRLHLPCYSQRHILINMMMQ